mgnify:FL=1
MNYKTRRLILAIVILALIACVVALGISVWKPEKEPGKEVTEETVTPISETLSSPIAYGVEFVRFA